MLLLRNISLIILYYFLVPIFSFSQLPQSIAHRLISTQGKTYTSNNGSISFSVGEPVINMLGNSGSDNATQGFQQINNLSTSLTSTYCGGDGIGNNPAPYQLNSLSELIYCNRLSPTNEINWYEWEFFNTATSTTYFQNIYGGWNNNISLAMAGIIPLTNDIYRVRVRVQYKNSFNSLLTEWGDACYIKAPTNSITTSLTTCGTYATPTVLNTTADNFYCNAIPNTHSYIFNFYKEDSPGSNTFPALGSPTSTAIRYSSSGLWMNLDVAQIFTSGIVYKVTVQSQLYASAGGGITSEGDECYIQSPMAPVNQIVRVLAPHYVNSSINAIDVYDNTILIAGILNPTIAPSFVYGYRWRFYSLDNSNSTYSNLFKTRPPQHKPACTSQVAIDGVGGNACFNVSSGIKNKN